MSVNERGEVRSSTNAILEEGAGEDGDLGRFIDLGNDLSQLRGRGLELKQTI